MELRKFIWIGYNRTLKKYQASEPMDTVDLLTGNYPKFFSIENRYEGGSCIFMGEVRNMDLIHFKMESGELQNYMLDIDRNGVVMLLGEKEKSGLSEMLEKPGLAEVTFSFIA